MRQLKKLFLAPATLFFINGCNPSSNSNLGDMPVYPPAPPPPFRYQQQPTKLFSNPEADFTCLTNEKNSSDVKCWGDNSHAQTNGIGTASESSSLITVAGIPKILTDPATGKIVYVNTTTGYSGDDPTKGSPYPLNMTHISVGKDHVCVSLSDYSIWCWGDNSYGQLTGAIARVSEKDKEGNEIKVVDTKPLATLRIGLNVLPDADVNALASGNAHTCAAFADGGNSIWCWGDNSNGQVTGNGVAETIGLEDGTISNSYPYTNVSQNSDLPKGPNDIVIALAAGHNFTCALYDHRANLPIEAQTVWCWGNNSAGQVTGEMNTKMPSEAGSQVATKATRVIGLPTNKIISLSAGGSHACVSMVDGNIWCWGNDQNAQVSGIKHTTSVSPGLTLVQGIPNGAMSSEESNVLSLTTGANFSCANFKTLGDDLWCWGDNQNGVIDGAGIQGSFAQRITRISAVRESVVLAAGARHVCAAFSEGEVKCWGDDSKGQVHGTGVPGKAFERITQLTLN